MITRLILAAALVLAIKAGMFAVHDRGMPTDPAPVEMKLEDLPKSLGDWTGEPVKTDPEMFKAIGANSVLDRLYRDHQGRGVMLQIAVFDKTYQAQGLWHQPDLCYSTHGWVIGEPRNVSLEPVESSANQARYWSAEKSGEPAYVLYWYQLDGKTFVSGDRQRQIVLGLRGRPERPPVIKVMLHTSGMNAEVAQKTLKEFANEVFAWTSKFH